MEDSYVWSVIVFAGAVTYLPRLLPFLLFSGKPLPHWFTVWLGYLPSAIFGALIFSEVFVRENGLNLALNNIYLCTSIGVFIISMYKKSLALSIVFGLLLFYLLQNQPFIQFTF